MNNVNTTTGAEFYESGIDPSSFISKGGANILQHLFENQR